MTDLDRMVNELVRVAALPDPSTLLFGVPSEAPSPASAQGRAWTVAHWIHCARRAGHHATPVDTTPVDTVAADAHSAGGDSCGQVLLDGLTYQVHRGPRRRVLVHYFQEDGQPAARFDLEESVWVEPLAPEPLPDDCPWCDHGPPAAFSLVGEGEADGVYLIGGSEHPDGSGRSLIIQAPLPHSSQPTDDPEDDDDPEDEDEIYCLVLDPGQHTITGDIVECSIHDDNLMITLTAEAARTLTVPRVLKFRLDVSDDQVATLRNGLRRALSTGPAHSRPLLRL